MGIFKSLKNTYKEEYDLDYLDEYSSDDDINKKYNNSKSDIDKSDDDIHLDEAVFNTKDKQEAQDKSVAELVSQFEKKYEMYNNQQARKKEPELYEDKKKEKALKGYDKAYEAKKKAQEEEERFDQLLSSVQAKDLMSAVDKINNKDNLINGNKNKKSSNKSRKLSKKLEAIEEENKKQLEIKKNAIRKTLIDGAKSASLSKNSEFTEDISSLKKVNRQSKVSKNISSIDSQLNNKTDNINYNRTNNTNRDISDKTTRRYKSLEAEEVVKTTNISTPEDTVNTKKESKRISHRKSDDRISNYIKEQCKIMEDASINIDMSMKEYENVTRQFSDVQMIEAAPEYLLKQISTEAERVDNLTVDRRMYKSDDKKLSNSTYHRMEMLEDDFDKSLKYLEKEESYYEAVKRDMRILEAERLSLRLDAQELTKRQLKVRKISLISVIFLVVIFSIFVIAMIAMDDTQNTLLFAIITALGAMIAIGMFGILRVTERQVLVTEKKINKAAGLLNKIKIKYINAANALDYGYSKYGVKSSYELVKKFEAYLEMKEEQKRVVMLTSSLNEAEEHLQSLLRQAGVYNTQIWLTRVKALYNKNEMVEVRHDLTVQRQRLRGLIQDNEDIMEDAKCNIMKVTNNNPEYMNDALNIIEDFERRSTMRKNAKRANY